MAVLAVAIICSFLQFESQAGAGTSCLGQAPTVTGTPTADRMTDKKLDDGAVIDTGAGTDAIELNHHVDDLTICSGTGADIVYAFRRAGKNARVDGGPGGDHIGSREKIGDPQPPPLELYGGGGSDRLKGASGHDVLFGQAGNDSAESGFGPDLIRLGPGDDDAEGNSGKDRLFGGAGNDQLVGGYLGNTNGPRNFPPDGRDVATGGPDDDFCIAEVSRECEQSG